MHHDFGETTMFSLRMPNSEEYQLIFTPRQQKLFASTPVYGEIDEIRTGLKNFLDQAHARLNGYFASKEIETDIHYHYHEAAFPPPFMMVDFVFTCSRAAANQLRRDMGEILQDYEITEDAKRLDVWNQFDMDKFPMYSFR